MSTDDHTPPDVGSDDTEPDDEIDVEAVGTDEIVRQERVRSIFEARKMCRERRLVAKEEDDQSIYRDALEGYVREVQPLLTQTEKGRSYWNTHDFGTIELTPHRNDLPESCDEINAVIDKQQLAFTGLVSLFNAGDPIYREASVRVPSPGRGRGDVIKTVAFARHIPFDILDSMFSVTNTYLSQIGFGVEVDQTQKNTKLDDDLMKEVEQWRRENL
jgi:hypothetical protein